MSILFQADADLNFDIVKAVRKAEPGIDFASSDDSHLRGVTDADVLQRAATANRVLVSHDRRTMISHFRAHLAAGKSSPGLLIVAQDELVAPVVESIVFVWAISDPILLRDQAYYVPSLMRHVFVR